MTNYIFTYHGGSGMPESQEAQDQMMAAWGEWMNEVGDKTVDGGNPVVAHKTLSADGTVSDGGPADTLSGYGIFSAESFEEALAIAKGCPVLAVGATVQVSETIQL